MGGNIMVDRILASCYPSTHHDLAHTGMSPIRWFPDMIKRIFGTEHGFQGYVKIAEGIGKWMQTHELTYGFN